MGEQTLAEQTSGEPQVDTKLVAQFERLSSGMAIAIICLAVVVLAGASMDNRSLVDFGTGSSVASAAAALCFILAGTALLTAKKTNRYKSGRPLGLVCSIAIIVIGSISLLEQLVGWSIISSVLRENRVIGVDIFAPDLISANTSFSFILLGICMLQLGFTNESDHRLGQLFAVLIGLFSWVAWIGYATKGQPAGELLSYTDMSLPEIVGLMLASVAALCAYPQQGLMRFLMTDNAGSIAARRLIPAIIVFISVLVWLKTVGETLDLYSAATGTWLFVLIGLTGLIALVSSAIRPLDRADGELRSLTRELKRSNRDLEDFAHVVSHDLKQPLRTTAKFAEYLDDNCGTELDGDGREYLSHVRSGMTRMEHLVEDLLTYAKVGRKPVKLAPTNASEACDHAIANLHRAIEESGATVEHSPLPTVIADSTGLEQVFQNLIGNSLKFCQEDPHISITSTKDNGKLTFAVRDNGIGIPPEQYDRVFKLFERLSGRSRYPGTGLGLAICKKVIERYGQRIWVRSKPGQETTFYFTMTPV